MKKTYGWAVIYNGHISELEDNNGAFAIFKNKKDVSMIVHNTLIFKVLITPVKKGA